MRRFDGVVVRNLELMWMWMWLYHILLIFEKDLKWYCDYSKLSWEVQVLRFVIWLILYEFLCPYHTINTAHAHDFHYTICSICRDKSAGIIWDQHLQISFILDMTIELWYKESEGYNDVIFYFPFERMQLENQLEENWTFS